MEVSGAGEITSAGADVTGAGGFVDDSAGADWYAGDSARGTSAGRFADDDSGANAGGFAGDDVVGRLADVAGAGRLVGADAGGFAGGVSFADEGSDDDAGEEEDKAAAVDDTGDDARVRE